MSNADDKINVYFYSASGEVISHFVADNELKHYIRRETTPAFWDKLANATTVNLDDCMNILLYSEDNFKGTPQIYSGSSVYVYWNWNDVKCIALQPMSCALPTPPQQGKGPLNLKVNFSKFNTKGARFGFIAQ
jgi:hypothetical protein